MLDPRLVLSPDFTGVMAELSSTTASWSNLYSKMLEIPATTGQPDQAFELSKLALEGFLNKGFLTNYYTALEIYEKMLSKAGEDQPLHNLEAHISIAEVNLELGQLATAEEHLTIAELMVQNLKSLGTLEVELRVLRAYAILLWHRCQYGKALENIKLGLANIRFMQDSQRSKYWQVEFLHIRSQLNYHVGDFPEAIVNTLTAMALVKEVTGKYMDHLSLLIKNTQFVVYRTIGEFELASEYADELEERLDSDPQSIEDDSLRANLFSSLGMFENTQGNFLKSLGYHNKSLSIHQNQTGSLVHQALSLANLARTLAVSGDFAKARETFLSAFRIYDQTSSRLEWVEKTCWYVDLLLRDMSLIEAAQLVDTLKHFVSNSKRDEILVDVRRAKWLKAINKFKDSRIAFLEVRARAEEANMTRESIQCSLYLAELAFEAFRHEDRSLREALNHVDQVLYLASKSHYPIYLVRAMKIKSEVLETHLEFDEALRILDDALAVTEEKNLFYLQGQILELRRQLVERRNLLTASAADPSGVSKQDLLSYIRMTTGRKPKLTEEDLDEVKTFYFAMFGFEKAKQHVITYDPLPPSFLTNRDFFDPITMGLIFSTSLGQGNRYNQGLYVLPTPDVTDFNSLVYAKVLSPPTNDNPTGTYLLIAINYHNEFDPLFYNRAEYEKFLNRRLADKQTLSQIDTGVLQELYTGFNELVLREINAELRKKA